MSGYQMTGAATIDGRPHGLASRALDGVPAGVAEAVTELAGVAMMVVMALVLAYGVSAPEDDGARLVAALVGTAAAGALLRDRGAWRIASLCRKTPQVTLLVPPLALGGLASLAVLVTLHVPPAEAPEWAVGWAAASLLLLMGVRGAAGMALRPHWSTGRMSRRVAIVGATDSARRLARTLAGDGPTTQVVGLFDDSQPAVGSDDPSLRVVGGIADLVARSRRDRIDTVVIALPNLDAQSLDAACDKLGSMIADIYVAPEYMVAAGVDNATWLRGGAETLLPSQALRVRTRPMTEWQEIQKAVFDRTLAFLVLVLISPVLAAIAVLIKLDSPGPVLFRQPRVGFNNVAFTMFKFRTMHHAMADLLADRQTLRGDSRVTKIGRTLRRLSLDELPQLINVLRGDMSLVGPRPHAPNTSAEGRALHDVVFDYAHRHRVKPGITGWAQVNGARGAIETAQHIQNRVRYDLEYIRNWSLWLDVKIMVLTVLREVVSERAF